MTSTSLVNDPDGQTFVDTTYDVLGRVSTVSNPVRGTPGPSDITTYNYDALNRPNGAGPVYAITRPDGSPVSMSYSATSTTSCVTTTDEAGNARTVCSDGLGRIKSVNEDPSGKNYPTSYTYDPLGDLKSVTQGQ